MHYGAVARRLHAERGGFAFLPGSLSSPADGTPTLRPHEPYVLPTREQFTSHRRGISAWGRSMSAAVRAGFSECLFRQCFYPTRRSIRMAPRRWVHEDDACPVVLLRTSQILLHSPDGLVFSSGQANDLI